MKTPKSALIGIFIAATSLAASFGNVKCPIDSFACYFTGKTQIVSGKLLLEHKCPQGHIVWIVQ